MNGFHIKRNFYSMASADGQTAEITMYGDVVESWPTDWWSGEKLEGSYIAQDEFLKDLDSCKRCSEITIRMNSYGGDSAVGFVIHNRLRELSAAGTKLTCIVDGVAMSAASVIMCACDTVRINPASLVMVHKCWSYIWGGYNADELRALATSQDAYDKAIVSAYKRKTGLSDTVLMHMMAEETYLTGKEAVEKGFADELIEDAAPVTIAASADKRNLIVNGRKMHLAPGMSIPENIPTVETAEETPAPNADATNIIQPGETGEEGEVTMTLDELREQNPELVAQIEEGARASAIASATAAAVQAEQARLQEIDEVASLFDTEMVNAAKYGEHACSAQELAYRAAVNAAKQGRNFLSNVEADNQESGVNAVAAVPGTTDEVGDEELTPAQKLEQARANIASILGKKEG